MRRRRSGNHDFAPRKIPTSLIRARSCAMVSDRLLSDDSQLAEVGLFYSFVFSEFGGGARQEDLAGFEDVGAIAVG
jgi:hypothetical protein